MTTNEDPKATSEGPEATGGDATATRGVPEVEPEQPKQSVEGHRPKRRGVMQSLTALCLRYVERLMPDPYLFAVILTLIVAALVALLVEGAAPSGMLRAWYGAQRRPMKAPTSSRRGTTRRSLQPPRSPTRSSGAGACTRRETAAPLSSVDNNAAELEAIALITILHLAEYGSIAQLACEPVPSFEMGGQRTVLREHGPQLEVSCV
jgi:hypothetical protein